MLWVMKPNWRVERHSEDNYGLFKPGGSTMGRKEISECFPPQNHVIFLDSYFHTYITKLSFMLWIFLPLSDYRGRLKFGTSKYFFFFVLILSLHKLINSADSHNKLSGHEKHHLIITIMGFLTVLKTSLQEFNVYTDEQKQALVPVSIVFKIIHCFAW